MQPRYRPNGWDLAWGNNHDNRLPNIIARGCCSLIQNENDPKEHAIIHSHMITRQSTCDIKIKTDHTPRRQDANKEIRDGPALYNPDITEKGEPERAIRLLLNKPEEGEEDLKPIHRKHTYPQGQEQTRNFLPGR